MVTSPCTVATTGTSWIWPTARSPGPSSYQSQACCLAGPHLASSLRLPSELQPGVHHRLDSSGLLQERLLRLRPGLLLLRREVLWPGSLGQAEPLVRHLQLDRLGSRPQAPYHRLSRALAA